jgi:hypothetical protein
LLGETITDENGLFQVAGATREKEDIEVIDFIKDLRRGQNEDSRSS